MKIYQRPELFMESLCPEEKLAGAVPTIVDEEYDKETSITNNFGDDMWD